MSRLYENKVDLATGGGSGIGRAIAEGYTKEGAQHPCPNMSMCLGAKAAVENFTRVWAMELAQDGVRVNAIAPGAIATDIWSLTDFSDEEAKAHAEAITSLIPMGRFGQPEDISNLAVFLGSDKASFITGAIYGVDGGQGA